MSYELRDIKPPRILCQTSSRYQYPIWTFPGLIGLRFRASKWGEAKGDMQKVTKNVSKTCDKKGEPKQKHCTYPLMPPPFSGTKNQPKEEVLGQTSRPDIRPKTLVRPAIQILEKKQAFWHGHAAQTSTKNFGLKNFGLIFHSLGMLAQLSCNSGERWLRGPENSSAQVLRIFLAFWRQSTLHGQQMSQIDGAKTWCIAKRVSTALLLNEVSEKSCEIWNEVSEIFSEICSEICPEIRPEIFRAFLAGRKVLPKNFTRFFPSEISNFKSNSKSNFTQNFTNTLQQAWQP